VSEPYIGDSAIAEYCDTQIKPAYVEAGRTPDAQYPIWSGRAVYDHAVGALSWPASCAKHLRECRDALGLTPPVPPPVLTLPRLRVNGHVFEMETGQPFTVIQCSDFNLLNRWQHGENIRPILEQRAGCRFNMLRVWTHYDLAAANIGMFLDIDYARVGPFLRLCASYGFYVELTAYTSTERPSHWDQLVEAAQPETNALVELVNEGTLPVNQIDMSRYARPTGVLASHGSGGAEGVPPWEPWDYITYHTNGASEEQRKIGHNAMEKVANVSHAPALTNETSRFPEVGMWVGADHGRRRALAFDSAAGAALLCAGSCFHSVQGKTSVLFDADTADVAEAWTLGARSVPLACQHENYTRRDDLLLLHPDLLRVYQRGSTESGIVRIRK
jgi:hypothetical protein